MRHENLIFGVVYDQTNEDQNFTILLLILFIPKAFPPKLLTNICLVLHDHYNPSFTIL
ncbi:MAG: hypothetical protein ACJAU1_001689 [Psychromonas sp.]|jgi:hypothetical protein